MVTSNNTGSAFIKSPTIWIKSRGHSMLVQAGSRCGYCSGIFQVSRVSQVETKDGMRNVSFIQCDRCRCWMPELTTTPQPPNPPDPVPTPEPERKVIHASQVNGNVVLSTGETLIEKLAGHISSDGSTYGMKQNQWYPPPEPTPPPPLLTPN